MENFMRQPSETTSSKDPLATLYQNLPSPTIYAKIGIIQNAKRQFLCSESIPSKYKTIRTNDNRIGKYFAAVLKIFGAFCKELQLRDLWVCQKQVTTYPILVYFTEPLWYPVMDCCNKCLFIEFESELSGNVKCIECKKVGFSFVHIGQDHRGKSSNRRYSKTQISQHKENNYMLDQKIEMEKQNEKIYKEYKHRNEHKKSQIRKLISSNQHRQQSIKRVMGLTNISMNMPKHNNEIFREEATRQTQVGEFIIEIDGTLGLRNQRAQELCCEKLNRNEIYRRQALNTEKAEKTNNNQNSLPETDTYKQLRSIIQSIFS